MPVAGVLGSYWALGGGAGPSEPSGCVCRGLARSRRKLLNIAHRHSNSVMRRDETEQFSPKQAPLGALVPADWGKGRAH